MKKRKVIIQHKADQNKRVIRSMEEHIKDLRRQLREKPKAESREARIVKQGQTFAAAKHPDVQPQGVDQHKAFEAFAARRRELRSAQGNISPEETRRLAKETGVTEDTLRTKYGPSFNALWRGTKKSKPAPTSFEDREKAAVEAMFRKQGVKPPKEEPTTKSKLTFQEMWQGGLVGRSPVSALASTPPQDMASQTTGGGAPESRMTPEEFRKHTAREDRKAEVLIRALRGEDLTKAEVEEFADDLMLGSELSVMQKEERRKQIAEEQRQRAIARERPSQRKWREFSEHLDADVENRRASGKLPPEQMSMAAIKDMVHRAIVARGGSSKFGSSLTGTSAASGVARKAAGLIVAHTRRDSAAAMRARSKRQDRGGWFRSKTGSLKRRTSSGKWEYKKR